jgi:hypothetical protein
MRRLLGITLALLLIGILTLTALAGDKETATQEAVSENKPNDAYGRVDVATVQITEVAPNHFAFELMWDNDQELAAMTYPLKVTGKNFAMHYDSVSWEGRADYFSVKAVRPEDSLQAINVGFVNDLGQGNPPLKPGKGKLATLFFTAGVEKGQANICDVLVDTTFIYPSNVLYGVTVGATGEVHPAYKTLRADAKGDPVICK